MIDYLALTLAHGLLLIGLFRIVQNDALDPEVKTPQRDIVRSQKPHVRRKVQMAHPSKRPSKRNAKPDQSDINAGGDPA